MEEKDQALSQRLWDSNTRFRMLYEEHRLLERDLEILADKPHLTPGEEVDRKKMQKLKLAGRDEMERILNAHRQ